MRAICLGAIEIKHYLGMYCSVCAHSYYSTSTTQIKTLIHRYYDMEVFGSPIQKDQEQFTRSSFSMSQDQAISDQHRGQDLSVL